MWTQMGQLFWGARFPGHPQSRMQSSGDPKCFNPFGKMDMGDPTAHLGHPMNKPGPSIPGATGMMTPKSETPRTAHSGHSSHVHNSHHSTHNSHHSNNTHSAHHGNHSMSTSSSSSSKHKSDIGYGHPNHPHQGSGGSSSSITNPYSHGTNGGPPPLLPNMQLPPPPPPQPSSHNSPLKHQSQERLKKCKAVFGQGQKELWCNKCRWKKKCIRFETHFIIR